MPSCEKIDTSRRGLIAKNIFLRAFFKSHFFGQTHNFNERKFLLGFCYGNKFDVFLHSWSQWQNFCNCTQTWIRMGLKYKGLWKFPFSAFKTVELLNPKNLTKPCLVKYFFAICFYSRLFRVAANPALQFCHFVNIDCGIRVTLCKLLTFM